MYFRFSSTSKLTDPVAPPAIEPPVCVFAVTNGPTGPTAPVSPVDPVGPVPIGPVAPV